MYHEYRELNLHIFLMTNVTPNEFKGIIGIAQFPFKGYFPIHKVITTKNERFISTEIQLDVKVW